MKVVIDTNVMVNAVFPQSKNYWIQQSLRRQQLELCVTTDILNEYAEVIDLFYRYKTVEVFFSTWDNLPNITYVNKYYFWQLIPEDPDDEKFIDCAIACGADYLVTNDRHFSKLKKLPFPKVNVVSETEFKEICEAQFGPV